MPCWIDVQKTGTALLAVRSGTASWSVPGAAVTRIERLSDWAGDAPLDVAQLVGNAGAGDAELRVLVLDTEGQELPLLARGTLALIESSPERLLAMPAAFHASAPLVDRVALIDGAPALFVLSPSRLLEAWRSLQRLARADSVPLSSR
jgi:hypothetical protein